MVVDDLFGVIHTAVTDFDGVAVKYLEEAEILTDVLAEWRVVNQRMLLRCLFLRLAVVVGS